MFETLFIIHVDVFLVIVVLDMKSKYSEYCSPYFVSIKLP